MEDEQEYREVTDPHQHGGYAVSLKEDGISGQTDPNSHSFTSAYRSLCFSICNMEIMMLSITGKMKWNGTFESAQPDGSHTGGKHEGLLKAQRYLHGVASSGRGQREMVEDGGRLNGFHSHVLLK